jgi:gamma-glutamyltranspeptidase
VDPAWWCRGYGFLLNNELTDFTPTVPHPNTPEPGKRPRSSMAPTLVMSPDGTILALGSPGGPTIITTVLQVLMNKLALGMDLEGAIAAPRLSQQNRPSTLVEASWIDHPSAQALVELGHHLEPAEVLGAVTAVQIDPDGMIQAVAEPSRYHGGKRHGGELNMAYNLPLPAKNSANPEEMLRLSVSVVNIYLQEEHSPSNAVIKEVYRYG